MGETVLFSTSLSLLVRVRSLFYDRAMAYNIQARYHMHFTCTLYIVDDTIHCQVHIFPVF